MCTAVFPLIVSDTSFGTWKEMDAFVVLLEERSYYWSLKSQLSFCRESLICSISH